MKFKSNDRFGIVLYVIGVIFLIITSYIGLSGIGLWADEIYTLAIVQMPFNSFLASALGDVHPILYYVMLKSFLKVFAFGGIAFSSKVFSLVPILLLGILSLTKIRKNFGFLTSALFFLFISSMPRILASAFEVRMYSWALFFVTASMIYAYEVTLNSTYRNWIVLTFLTICSAYTHYFSAIASFSIYIVLLLYILRKNRSLLKFYLISSLAALISYLPWLAIVRIQSANVGASYWIDPITFNSLITYIYYIFTPAWNAMRSNEVLSPAILPTLLLLSFIYLFYRNRDEFTSDTLLAFLLVPLIGIAASFLFRPVFHVRYMIPSLGCFWLVFAHLLSKSFSDLKVFAPVLVLVLIIGVSGIFAFIPVHEWDVYTSGVEGSYISNVGEGSVVIINNVNVYSYLFYYYAPNNTYVLSNASIASLIGNNSSDAYYVDVNDDVLKNENLSYSVIPTDEPVIGYKIYKIQ